MFCDALVAHCGPGRGLYGSATITSGGAAVLRTRLAAGIANVQAIFVATAANAASTSLTNAIAVAASPIYASSTTLNESGSVGAYTLRGAVSGFGTQSLGGTLAFLDSTNANVQIGSASLNSPTRSFAGAVPYAVGSDPKSSAVSDFNGDGIPDLVVANYGDNTVSVLLGNGDGTFQPKVTYAAGPWPVSVAVGDFTGNGIQDLVVANNGTGTLSILLGNGNGTFQAPVTYASSGSNPVDVVVADLNGDGIPDLAVAGDGAVAILLGKGDGTFQPQVTYSTSSVARAVAVADFNGDGIPDLVVADEMTSEVSVFLGNGNGTFRAPATYAAGAYVWDIKVGDFNGDGIADVVVANYVGGTVSVLLGNGDGTLRPPVAYATGAGPWAVALTDVNGDGIPDLVATNNWGGTVSVLFGNGDGTFQPQVTLTAGVAPMAAAVGDFNGDGFTDLAITDDSSNTVLALLGDQSATFSASGISISGSGTHNVFASYRGDASRTASQSATVPLTATMITPTVTVSCSPTSITYGPSNLTYCTVNVSGSATGNTSMTYNGTSWGSVPLSSGTAVYGGMNGQPAGTYSIVASYAGDSNYTAATGPTTFTINKAPTVTEISSSSNPIAYGGSTTFTALVDTGGAGTWGPASVAFTSNGVPIGSGTVSSVTTTNLLPYSQNLLGSTWSGYCGPLSNMTQNTPDFMAPDGTATAAKFVVANAVCAGPGSNGVLIGGLPSGMTAGQSYTNSVWLRGAVGGETVSFGLNDCAMVGVTLTSSWKRYTAIWPTISTATATCESGRGFQVIGANETYYMWGAQTEQSATAGPYVATGSVPAPGSGGIATLTTSTLPVGSDSIVATYSGDANTLASTSSPLSETVADAMPTVAVSCSPNPITYGSGSTCTATVGGGATGTVAWTINGSYAWGTTTISFGTTTNSGFTANGPGSYTIGIAYSGDSDNSPESASTTLAISQAAQTITFTAPASPVTYGVSPIALTATATSGLGVTFSVQSGPGSISGNTLTITGVGTVVVAANQAGNTNFLPAVQATQSLTVNSGVTSTTLAVLPSNSLVAGAVVTLTATVKNPSAVTQGVVLFCNALAAHCSQGLGLYGSVSLSTSGTAVLKMKLPVGVNNVQAVFVATSVNAASTSSPTAVTVVASPIYASSTTLAYGGVPGNYNLGGFVTAYGGQVFGSSVALLDTTNGNAQIATSALSLPYFQYVQTMNPIASRSWSSVVGDFNGDGIPDLAVATYTGNALDILIGNGDGTFRAAVPYALTSAASSVVVGDFNGDGKLDLAVANWQTNDISIFIGVGDGTFLPQVRYAVGTEPTSISVGDFNRDGVMDLAVTNQVGNTVSVLIGQGDGTFKPQVTYTTGTSPYSVTNGDFNEDGKLDLAIANYGGSTISVQLGNGDGTFQAQVPYTVGTAPSAVTTGDLNNDGHLDLAVANSGSSSASILIGHGDGTFSAAVSYPTGSSPMSVSLGDFNNDGDLDLITGNSGSDTLSLLLGTGSGTFGTQSTVAGGYSYQGLAVGDFNGDGLLDFAANQNGGTATELVFLGQLRESFNVTGVSILGSGTHNVRAAFPGDALRTASQSATVPLTATKLTPVLTWAGPSGIMYGTPLSATQLNATSGGAAGTFVYAPAAGAIVPAGSQTLSVTFTPTDTTTYNSASTTVTIYVNKVTPTLTWGTPAAITYGTALSATQLNASSGGVAGTFVYAPAAGTVLGVGSKTLSVTFTPTDTANYNTSTAAIYYLTVNKAALTVTPNPVSRPYGTANPAFYGSISGLIAGDGITPAYHSSADVSTGVGVYSTGANSISASLSDPNNKLGNYLITSNLGTLTITQATATMNLTSSLNPSKYGDSVTFTVTATGAAGAANPTGTVTVSDGGTTLATITLDASGTATKSIQTLTVGSHSLSAVYGGDTNYK
jgi:hypothetical protein